MMSPECTPYSNFQNLNMRKPAGRAKVELARRRGDVHLKFCMTLARMQMEGGQYFIYEHPKSAASWNNPDVDKLASTEGVMRSVRVRVDVERRIGRGTSQEADLIVHEFR